MNYAMKKGDFVRLAYFSGTGCTAKVAEVFQKLLLDNGFEAEKTDLGKMKTKLIDYSEDILILMFAVHACNAPEVVYEWIEELAEADKKPAVVLSVSGGGEVFPNIACRVGCINRLEKKGFNVIYEKMIVMPSNWIVATNDTTAVRLLTVLPLKIQRIIDDLNQGIKLRTEVGIFDRIVSAIGELEKIGAKSFGKKIVVNYSCNACGWCEKGCPKGNIKIIKGNPTFSNKCMMCLKCIYGCPNKALTPGSMKFIVIKDGFSITRINKLISTIQPVKDENLPKGYLWKGVRNYLLDSEIRK